MPVPQEPEGDHVTAADYPPEAIAAHIDEERRRISLLGEIREVVFGAQDGLVSTLAVVAAVVGATDDQLAVLIAGLAAAMAGVFSMAFGEYMGSKSQAEIFHHQMRDEWAEVKDRRAEAEAELSYLFVEEGLPREDADQVAAIISRHPRSLLATMVAKELGLSYDAGSEKAGTPLRGALFMGGAFAVGAIPPIAPFLFGSGIPALLWAAGLTGAALFSLGAIKSRWTGRAWIWSGLEILSLAGLAGVAGYLFGSALPALLGFAVP